MLFAGVSQPDIIETLKQRKKQVFRAVPVPRTLIPLLTMYGMNKKNRL